MTGAQGPESGASACSDAFVLRLYFSGMLSGMASMVYDSADPDDPCVAGSTEDELREAAESVARERVKLFASDPAVRDTVLSMIRAGEATEGRAGTWLSVEGPGSSERGAP